jgi:hypothetical protein
MVCNASTATRGWKSTAIIFKGKANRFHSIHRKNRKATWNKAELAKLGMGGGKIYTTGNGTKRDYRSY